MTATPTAQEVFDLAVAGVLKQGKQSRNSTGRCVYRGPNGLKCAAGFVFTDEEVEGVDGFHFDGPFEIDAETVIMHRAPRLKPHSLLLENLQGVHDRIRVEDWPRSFRALAEEYSLSPAVIDQWEAEQAGGDS